MSHVAHRELPIPAGGLVVSCQSPPGNPLQGPQLMAAFARAAEYGGAMAIRANGPADVAAIRAATDLPVIGINKTGSRQGVYITPTPATAAEVVAAGAAMVAVDGTDRPRPQGWTLPALVDVIHHEFGVPVMADCDSMASAAYAAEAGCDMLSTTLAGYTGDHADHASSSGHPTDHSGNTGATIDPADDTNAPAGPRTDDGAGPDLDLLAAMAAAFDLPVIAEGRYSTPAHLTAAYEAGAHAVVVGTAITNPAALTRSFVAAAQAQPHR